MSNAHARTLQQLSFDNRFVNDLPADPVTKNTRRKVNNACFSWVQPTAVQKPEVIAFSNEMLLQLDLSLDEVNSDEFAQVFSGNAQLKGMQPYAMCYGGHQFGHWAGQLGDGRAILLGDVINSRKERWSLQLKGAGPTPYSRTADGLAVLRSSLREFLCSEAMHHLGVPTTRALSLIKTGEQVMRDMLYDGHPAYEPGAVVCRVAPSFTRFGNFQILTAQKDTATLKKLVDYTIKTDFPDLGAPEKAVYVEWFREVCKRTADMVVHWMRVGFVHGVMNTDNMSILGLTIDYGPYGWLEDYDPDWTPNTTDANGRRYRFGQQTEIALWNLLQLAEAIFPLINDTEPLEHSLQFYRDYYQQQWNDMMAHKLGFHGSSDELVDLNKKLLVLLQSVETDMTLFYRSLADCNMSSVEISDEDILRRDFAEIWYRNEQVNDVYLGQLKHWLTQYHNILRQQGVLESDRISKMNSVNPLYVPRNYLAQVAIDKATDGDYTELHRLMDVLKKPYQQQAGMEQYSKKRPEWARHKAGCSMLSCSS